MTGARVSLDLSGLAVEVAADDAALLGGLARIWEGFEARGGARAALEIRVEAGRAERGDPADKRVTFAPDGDGGTFVLAEGRVRIEPPRGASVVLADPDGDARAWALHNLLLPAIAWSLGLSRGGALVHGAVVVVEGRAFVLAGPEGSGKSTFAAAAARGGAVVVGEDLVFLDGAGDGLEAIATPYRTENATRRGPGRWPLAAMLWPRKAPEASLAPIPRLGAVARLAANVPYLAAAGFADGVAERIAARVPVLELAFAPDPGFVGLLRTFAGGRARGGSGGDSGQ